MGWGRVISLDNLDRWTSHQSMLARQSRQHALMASWQLSDAKNRFGAVGIGWRSAKVVADVGGYGDRESRCGTSLGIGGILDVVDGVGYYRVYANREISNV